MMGQDSKKTLKNWNMLKKNRKTMKARINAEKELFK